jgi:hypothetical protein
MSELTGLSEFKRLLKEFRNLSIWTAGASLLIPFVAQFLSIIPPWPKGLSAITAILELVTLILAYQGFKNDPPKVTRSVRLLAAASFVILLVYITSFTLFTIYVPIAGRSIVIGYTCLSEAAKVFGDRCPFLNLDDLSGVAYDEFLLWTKWSVSIVRTSLVALWLLLFFCLSLLIGQFLVFQMKRRVSRS